jgi:hypothetical protein
MGYFYTGFDYKNRKNGYFKIGETGMKYLSARFAVIRQSDCFQCLGYLVLPNSTKAERRLIESTVRLQLERATQFGLTQIQNDHFSYSIRTNEKYEQAYEIAGFALDCAIKACEQWGIEYTIGTKEMTRG